MAVVLTKGQNLSLSKTSPGINAMTVGLAWDARTTSGAAFDLDAIALLLGEDGKVAGDDRMIYFNNLSAHGVRHTGDNRTGLGDGDDEKIKIDLHALPAGVKSIDIAIVIFDTGDPSMNFGLVNKSSCRVVDDATGEELARIDLQEDASDLRAIVMGTIYRSADGLEWKFRARGDGFKDLRTLVTSYGVNVQ